MTYILNLGFLESLFLFPKSIPWANPCKWGQHLCLGCRNLMQQPLDKAYRNRREKRDQEWLLLCNPTQVSVSVAKHWKRSQFQLIIIKAFPTLEAQRPASKASWYLRGKDARATGPCKVRQANLLTLSEDSWGFIFLREQRIFGGDFAVSLQISC